MQARPRARRSPSLAAFLSFLWPGLGQAYAGRRVAAVIFALPPALLALYVLVQVGGNVARFGLSLFVPSVAFTVLVVTLVVGAWWIAGIVDAYRSVGRHDYVVRGGWGQRDPRVRRGPVVLATLLVLVVAIDGYVAYGAWSFYEAGSQIFVGQPRPRAAASTRPRATRSRAPASPGTTMAPEPTAEPTPEPTEAPLDLGKDRINVLITGLDSAPGHQASLTDTLMVVSFDPRTKKVAMVSFPRDIAYFRLSNREVYKDKINTFFRYARDNGDRYPDGPMPALTKEIGHLLGVRMDYYASINYEGFRTLIDEIGGVDVTVERDIEDPSYGFGPDKPVGFFLPAGKHHLDGERALAFARSRKGRGDSDFTRASRQQQLLFAVRKKLTDPAIFPRLPGIIEAVGRTVKTNFPAEDFPGVLEATAEVKETDTKRYVLGPPYSFHPPSSQTGGSWTLKLKMDRVAKLSVELFGADSRYARTGGSP